MRILVFNLKMYQVILLLPNFNWIFIFRDAAIKNHKFGLIYQAVGDTTEKELFKHYEHSERMEKFLLMLGTKTELSKQITENERSNQHKGVCKKRVDFPPGA